MASPDDFDAMMARADQEIAEVDDRMARAFGDRPAGQEHRVWVDHEGLLAAKGRRHDLELLFGYTGLGALRADDPELPPALRRLLRAGANLDDDTVVPGLLAVPAVGGALFLAGFALDVSTRWGSDLVATGLGLVIGGVVLVVATSSAVDWLSGRLGRPLPGQPAYRLQRAVEELKASPFVVVAQGQLVENLPSLSWLEARGRELREAARGAGNRAGALEKIAARLGEARRRLGEDGPDPQQDLVARAVVAQRDLAARATALAGRVEERSRKLRAELDRLGARVDVEALRREAAALTGEPVPSTPERVAAELEVDVADLAQDVDALRSEITDQEARYAAMNEVSAIQGR